MKLLLAFLISLSFLTYLMGEEKKLEKDLIKTSTGDLEITFVGHGSLMMKFKEKIIHIDPYSSLTDYSKLPKGDLILITHHHRDHLDPKLIKMLSNKRSITVVNQLAFDKIKAGIVMKNGDRRSFLEISVEAVPAYNLVHRRESGELFHPKGEGNGYILTFGKTRVYIAGDSENTPEMKSIKNIDYAFLPMNLPYTMTPEMVVDAAKTFKPRVLYPYHYGESDLKKFKRLMKQVPEVEVRVRSMK